MEVFKNIYSDDDRIHNYLKSFETEILEMQKYFYEKIKNILKRDIIILEKI